MKRTLTYLFLLLPLLAMATVYELSDAMFDSLRATDGVEMTSEREKHGESITETWRGVTLATVAGTFESAEWAQLVVTSPDNYQVRIPADRASEVLLAWSRDGEPLPEPRIVWPGMREMHWVRNPFTFETRTDAPLPTPHIIYICSGIRANVPLRDTLPPFPDVTGYHMADLAQHAFPNLRGEFLLISRDGVRHTFDWTQFLALAVLIRGEGGLDMKSVAMPGGMWMRDTIWLQQDDTALLMLDRFDNWHDVSKLLGWDERPATITATHFDGTTQTINLPEPGDAAWQDIIRFTW